MNKHTYIALTLIAFLPACGDGGSPSQSAVNGVDLVAQSITPAIAVGEPGKAGAVQFTVTAVSTTGQIGPAPVGAKAEPGETFVVVSYTIKNVGSATLPFVDRPGVTLVDVKGQSYEPDMSSSMMAAGMMSDTSGMASDLNPNVSAKTKVAWKVDKAAFDKASWTAVTGTDPALTFALK